FSKEIRLGEFQIQAACGNANYDVEFEFGTLTVTLPKVAVGTITQNYTFNPEGIQIFNWQTQIVDYIPEITSDSAFVAKLMQNGNVIMSGNVLSGVVPAGEYTLVIEIVHVSQYEWQSGVVNSYPITVAKLDISDTIVEQGFTNGGWITNSSSGVSAMSQNNFNIYVDVTLSMDGQVVSNLTKCGNYTLTAVIDDANYCGQKTFSFRVIEDIAPTMAELNAMLNSYSAQADFATRMNKLTAMVELVATLNNDDAQLQIENNFIYTQLIQSVNTNWAEYVEDSKQDVQVASSVWQNVVLKAVATISLLSAAAFVAKRRLGL
ncbi:MAG: hypothetical protein J6Q55_03755, partial [Clostridia bacterium]|nr:hypothetical protein [Clostridia bacterium]